MPDELATLRTPLGDLLTRYPGAIALLVSALIFYNGCQILKERDRANAMAWWIWAGTVLVAYSISAVYYRMWAGLVFALVGIAVEVMLAVRLDLRS